MKIFSFSKILHSNQIYTYKDHSPQISNPLVYTNYVNNNQFHYKYTFTDMRTMAHLELIVSFTLLPNGMINLRTTDLFLYITKENNHPIIFIIVPSPLTHINQQQLIITHSYISNRMWRIKCNYISTKHCKLQNENWQ